MKSSLLRFLALHLLVGAVVGLGTLSCLLLLDVGGLGTLLWASEDWPVLIVLLTVFFVITFGSLAMGTGIMSLRREKPFDPDPPRRLQPVPIVTRVRRNGSR